MVSFLARYQQLGVSFDPAQVRVRQSLRVNTLKISSRDLLARLKKNGVVLEPIPYARDGYWYRADFSLGATPEYLQGYYYLQEAASQLPPLVLDPHPGDVVLDMAAAPGSKTTQLAQLMNDTGVIIALDSDAYRLASLRNNLERLGITSVVSLRKDARFAFDLGLSFDKVLLDAPCTGNFCLEPDFFSSKSVEGVKDRARLQKELLRAAYKVLTPGGVLVYSTCSLEPEEDELVIDWFLRKYPDVRLEETGLVIGDPGLTRVFDKELDSSLVLTRRFWPHKTGTQGFFIAKIRKGGVS